MTLKTRWLLALCVPILLVFLIAAWLIYTPSGTRQIFNLLSYSGVLTYRDLEGSIGSGLKVAALSVETEGVKTTISEFTLVLRLRDLLRARLVLERLRAEQVTLELSASGQSEPQTARPLDYLKLRQGLIPFELILEDLSVQRLTIISPAQDVEFGAIHLSTKVDEQGVADTQLSLNYGVTRVQLKGTAYLFPALQLDLHADWSTPIYDQGSVHGQTRVEADALQLNLLQHTNGDLISKLDLQVDNWLETPFFKLNGELQYFALPTAQQQSGYALSSLNLQAQGPLAKLQTTLTGKLSIPKQQPYDVSLKALVSPERLEIQSLAISGDQAGKATLNGHLGWAEGVIRWQNQLLFDEFNASPFYQPLPDALKGLVHISGQWSDELQLQLNSPDLQAQLYNHPIQARFKLQSRGNEVRVETLAARSGNNNLQLQGTFSKNQLAAELALDINALESFYPAASGSLQIDAALAGNLERPTLKARLHGQAVSIADLAIEDIQVTIQLIEGHFLAGKNNLVAAGIRYQEQTVDRVQLTAQGDWRQPTLDLDAASSQLKLRMQTRPQFQQQQISGVLSQLEVSNEKYGLWQLQNHVDYRLRQQDYQFSALCLAAVAGQFCAKGLWLNDQFDVTLDGEKIPAALLNLNESLSVPVTGVVDIQGALQGTLKNPDFSLRVFQAHDDDVLLIGAADEAQKQLTLSELNIDFSLKNELLTGEIKSKINKDGSLSGSLSVQSLNQKTSPLSGEFHFHLPDLQPYAQLLPEIDHLQGELRGRIQLGGTLQRPDMRLESELNIASIYINALAVEWTDLNLKTSALSDFRQRIQGTAKAGEGTLKMDGALSLNTVDDWQIELQITGENALLMNHPGQRVAVTPDFTLKVTPTMVDLQGDVLIPSANIVYQRSASRLSLTPDAVVHGEQGQSVNGEAFAYQLALLLEAGDDVKLAAYGLKTNLKGVLRLNKPLDGSLTGQGQIELIDGAYQAYGQDLAIDRGFIIFSGALSEPALDLEASRRVRDVRAGLRVNGPVSNLKTTLFSEPPLPETEILSYILRGKSLKDSNSQEKNALANALLAYSISQSSPVTSRISELSGLDEIGLEAEEGINTVGITLGKYITPRLYVRYGIGLVDQLSKLFLQYRLTDRLFFETESGSGQSLDLIYRSQ